MHKEALYYKNLHNDVVKCLLCPHGCMITNGNTGRCRVRQNINGKLTATSYGRIISANIDPIEKKPLYHFLPSTQILSLGSYSCNMKCIFCQNYHISQHIHEIDYFDYKEAITYALNNSIPSIAYTYNEPTVWYEYMLDCAKHAKENGLKNVIVTNGLINEEPLLELIPYIDAVNIDLKAFDDEHYNTLSGKLETVKRSIEICHKHCHVEITNLLVTDFNDDRATFESMVDFIASIDKNIPLHISRYFPAYEYNALPTNYTTLEQFYYIAKDKLNYCYIGNYNDDKFSNTYCPNCNDMIIQRTGYDVNIASDLSRCDKCSNELLFVL